MGKLRHLLLSIQRGRNEGERMAKLRHLLSSIQGRRGVRAREWVSFVICGRRSIGGGI